MIRTRSWHAAAFSVLLPPLRGAFVRAIRFSAKIMMRKMSRTERELPSSGPADTPTIAEAPTLLGCYAVLDLIPPKTPFISFLFSHMIFGKRRQCEK